MNQGKGSASNNRNTRSHITDSSFFGDGFGTEEVRRIFSDEARMQRWLDIEVALVKAQSELGIIPENLARELVEAAKFERFNADIIQQDIALTKHSLIPLIKMWAFLVSEEAAQYIHYGATTQDIQDTAQVIEIREVASVVKRDLKEIIVQLTELSKKYRNLIMVGRTHFQHALPVTLGFKIAGWLDECIRNFERLVSCEKRCFVCQLFGGTGTMAAFSEKGLETLNLFSKNVDLTVPDIAWHNARDRIVEFINVLAMISGTLSRVANEIIQLGRNEIRELFEPFQESQVGSSTMPQKHNPEDCERVVTLARLVKGFATVSYDTLSSEHERDYRSVRLEWITVTDASLYTSCALSIMKKVINGLSVNEQQVKENVSTFQDVLSVEKVVFFLSKKINKNDAFECARHAYLEAARNDLKLIDELLKFEKVKKSFTRNELELAFQPFDYLGLAPYFVDKVVEKSVLKFFLNDNVKFFYDKDSSFVVTYKDPIEHFDGWLVIDDKRYSLSAGGMRVQKGLTLSNLKKLANNMTMKMRLCDLPINGAKAGIDYDPTLPTKRAALERFVRSIKPFLLMNYSMGPDLNTSMEELTEIVAKNGISSVKAAVAIYQGYDDTSFKKRVDTLGSYVFDGCTLGEIRSGYGLAKSIVRVSEHLNISSKSGLIAIQGFGTLAKGAIYELLRNGFKIHAISDEHRCVISKKTTGLPVKEWLKPFTNRKLPELSSCAEYDVYGSDKIYDIASDILVLAATENAITKRNADMVSADIIICGANLAVTDDAEYQLCEEGKFLLPSCVAGCGGVISMLGLFGPDHDPPAEDVLSFIEMTIFKLVDEMLVFHRDNKITLTQLVRKIVYEKQIPFRIKPYKV